MRIVFGRIMFAFLLAALGSASALAAIIGPTNDWLPLSEGARQFGLTQATVDMLLDAGGEINCRRMQPSGKNSYQTLVGWAVANWPGRILTNAHMLHDDRTDTIRPDFDNCYFIPNRVVAGTLDLRSFEYALESDPSLYRTGVADEPWGKDTMAYDRMLVPIADHAPTVPMELHPITQSLSNAEVYLVSDARAFHSKTSKGLFEPMIQRCSVLRIDVVADGPTIRTSCDTFKGTSGSMYFIMDTTTPGALVPVALAAKTREYKQGGVPVDNLPADAEYNANVGIVFDDTFFQFDAVPDLTP